MSATDQDRIYQKAKELAFKDWPAAYPYGRSKWVQENYRSDRYITLAKVALAREKRDALATLKCSKGN
jgi:hypothetical protein